MLDSIQIPKRLADSVERICSEEGIIQEDFVGAALDVFGRLDLASQCLIIQDFLESNKDEVENNFFKKIWKILFK